MFGQFGRFACERRAARRRVCAGGFERILKASFLGDAGWLAVACPVDPREKLARGGGVGAGRTRRAGGKTR